ncbi:MAG: NAD(P)/FAD-dependent oxidoreductase [Gemmatimonadales bacterium]
MSNPGQIIVVGGGLSAVAVARELAAAGESVCLVGEPAPRPGRGHPVGWYSAWWPGDDRLLAAFGNESVDRLESVWADSGGAFALDRRGQVFVTADPDTANALRVAAGRLAGAGASVREHVSPEWYLPSPASGFQGVPGGIDVFEGTALTTLLPFLSPRTAAAVQVRRAGMVDREGLRRWLAESFAREGGVTVRESPVAVEALDEGHWEVVTPSGDRIRGRAVVVAGRRTRVFADLAGWDLVWDDWTRLVCRLGNAGSLLAPHRPMVASLDQDLLGLPASPFGELPASGLEAPVLAAVGEDLQVQVMLQHRIRAGDVAAVGQRLMAALEDLLPGLARRRGPPGNLTVTAASFALAPDRRPLVGIADRRGGYVVAALSAGVSRVLGAARLAADYLGGRSLGPLAPHLAPARLTLARQFPAG